MNAIEVTIIGKPGCHLCDDARDVVSSVVTELSEPPTALDIAVKESSIFDDADLYDAYVEEIPVILVNGRVHTYWRVDPARFRKALQEV